MRASMIWDSVNLCNVRHHVKGALLALIIGGASFAAAHGIQYLFGFTPHLWISIIVGVVAGVYSFIQALLNVAKTLGEIKKLQHELRELKRAEQERRSRVLRVTPDLIEKFGVSEAQRQVRIRCEEQEQLPPQTFIRDYREETRKE